MFDKVKQLKELRDQASQMKKMLAEETVHAEAADGKITLVMDGNMDVLSIDIDDSMLQPDQKDTLQQAMQQAVNDGIKKAQHVMAQKMQSMGGLNMPGM